MEKNELKTLKNLPNVGIMVPDLNSEKPCDSDLVLGNHVPIADLKALMVQYMKLHERQIAEQMGNQHRAKDREAKEFHANKVAELLLLNGWIKHVFNITKEDMDKWKGD